MVEPMISGLIMLMQMPKNIKNHLLHLLLLSQGPTRQVAISIPEEDIEYFFDNRGGNRQLDTLNRILSECRTIDLQFSARRWVIKETNEGLLAICPFDKEWGCGNDTKLRDALNAPSEGILKGTYLVETIIPE